MTNTAKYIWIIWFLLTLIVTIGTVTYKLSIGFHKTEIHLTEGSTVNIKIFRPLPHPISMKLVFARDGRSLRPEELGKYTTTGNWRETGKLSFINPGEPVLIKLSNKKQEVTYETMPISSHGSTTVGRDLITYENDNNLSEFSWPPNITNSFNLHAGFNGIQATILKVGAPIYGEKVTLSIKPPLGAKSTQKNYIYLAIFFFWPIYYLVLFIAFIILKRRYGLSLTKRSNGTEPTPVK